MSCYWRMKLVLFIVFLGSAASYKPARPLKCGVNEYPVPCKTICPPQKCDISYTEYACDPKQKCIPGCDCIKNYLRDNDNKCVFNENCPPPPTVSEEVHNVSPPTPSKNPSGSTSSGTTKTQSASQSNNSSRTSSSSSQKSSSSSQSSASSNASSQTSTSKNETGVPSIKCGVNEYAVPCKTLCPPQNCDIAYTDYLCDPDPKCIPGCDCIKNYLRNDESICVYSENCPWKLKISEELANAPPQSPQNTSGSTSPGTNNAQSTRQSRKTSSSSSSSASSRSSSSTQSSSSSNASSHTSNKGTGGKDVKRLCTYNRCTPTCSLPNPQNCPQNSNPCNCPPGTIISDKGGKCVPREECQKYANCKGDYNASYTDCSLASPSTCAKPNAEFSRCGNPGCSCNYGYLLSEINGKCIKPEECPGGNVCGRNETFTSCSIACPNNYCPTSDSRAYVACDAPYPCPSGCICEANYRRKSEKENICILASDCPPVNCTRPNEEWNPCPPLCFSDYCSARNVNVDDCRRSSVPYCDPKCVCKQGFYRNENEICIPDEECPSDN